MTGNAKSHAKRRQVLRKKLEAQGVDPVAIERAVERKKWEQAVERAGGDHEEAARRLRTADPSERGPSPIQPDDSKHRPKWVDPVLRGPARATGDAARAIKRGSTIRWESYRGRR